MIPFDWPHTKQSLQHVLWIGGAPCAGKSTVSGRLSDDFGLRYYDGDRHFEDHFETACADESPLTYEARVRVRKEGSSAWMFEQESEEMATFMRDLGQEDLVRAANDLLVLPSNRPIVVDLYNGHPPWVRKIADPSRMVFLVSTAAFQESGWRQRDGAFRREIERCSDPERAMEQFIKCCCLMSHRVRAECRRFGLPLLITGGCMNREDTYKAVCHQFGLSLSSPQRG